MLSGLWSVEKLAAEMTAATKPVVIDASWHLPTSGRNAAAEYMARHIEGAVFFDIDRICERNTSLPHMLPSADFFAEEVSKLGISNDDIVVIYDSQGMFSAARVWWMFYVFGHRNVFLLDGGLPAWVAAKQPVAAGNVERAPAVFKAVADNSKIAQREDVLKRIAGGSNAQIIDARSPARFNGQEKEPRPDLRSGHIPQSINIYFRDLLDPASGKFLPEDMVRSLFASRHIDMDRPIITSCGSGVTAAILSFALHSFGKESKLYDGAWAEWGRWNTDMPEPTPVEHNLTRITGFYMPPLVTVEASFTALDMARPLGQPAPEPPAANLNLHKVVNMPVDYYRYLYLMVGRQWHWTERLLLDDVALSQLLSHPARVIYVLYNAGVPAGFFEIYSPNASQAQIPYIGLKADFIGKGVGRYLIEQAVIAAWRNSPERVTLHTTSLDHPNTLPMLQKAGFTVSRNTREIALKFLG